MTYENMTDRELDALVAEKIFKKRYWLERRGRDGNQYELAVGTRPDGREPWCGSRDSDSRISNYREVSAQEAQHMTAEEAKGEAERQESGRGDVCSPLHDRKDSEA